MRSRSPFVRGGAFVFAAASLISSKAYANGLEIPENGTEVMGRAGAWTARADNPLAAGLNPAGLAGQKSAGIVNANLVWQHQCFQRAGTYASKGLNNDTPFREGNYEGQPFPQLCKKNGFGDLNAIPQLGFTYAVSPKLGIGFLPLWTPAGTGKAVWPDANYVENQTPEVYTANGAPAPAPQRFMLLSKDAKIIMPTLGVGYEVIPGLRLGASFQWVITMFKSQVGSQATQDSEAAIAQGGYNVTRSEVSWTKLFTPAFVLGALASPHRDVDIGAMFRWSAPIKKEDGTVTIYAPMYGNPNKDASHPAKTEAHFSEMKIPQPWEIRVGVRYHPLREGVVEAPAEGRRDFLDNDQFDIELDGTYANNSQFDRITILFPAGQCVQLGSSACPGFVPPDASIDKQWKNTFGVRLGGEYVVLPKKLGIRAGGFWQSEGQDPKYLNIDFHPGMMLGGYLGGTYRVTERVDVSLGAGYIWVKPFDNTATGGALRALTSTQPAQTGPAYPICPDAPAYRSCQVINTGVLKTSYIMASLGTTVRF